MRAQATAARAHSDAKYNFDAAKNKGDTDDDLCSSSGATEEEHQTHVAKLLYQYH